MWYFEAHQPPYLVKALLVCWYSLMIVFGLLVYDIKHHYGNKYCLIIRHENGITVTNIYIKMIMEQKGVK